MSWIDRIQNDLIITTGDGKEYIPKWKSASFKQEFNVSQFNFPDQIGTLVKRKEALGREFTFEIFFDGDNHIEDGLEFWESTKDKSVWTIKHPYYSNISVQPLSLNFDNTDLNLTRITGSIMETILETNPKTQISPAENVQQGVEDMEDDYVDAFTEIPTPNDLNTITKTNAKAYSKGVPIIEIPAEYQNYTNLYNTANSYVSTAIATPLQFMRAVIGFITYPQLLSASIQNRIGQLEAQWDLLKLTVEADAGASSKQLLQNQGAATIAAMAYSSVTPLPGDYNNNNDVIFIINKIVTNYQSFTDKMDELQSVNGGNPRNFIPNNIVLFKLNQVVNTAIANLFIIALSAKQKRSIILMEDTNLINLTHKLYSLDPADNNMIELMNENNLAIQDLIQIKKNTTIYYYI